MTRAHIDRTRPCNLTKVAETVTIASSKIGEPMRLAHHLISEMTIPPPAENFQILWSILKHYVEAVLDYLASIRTTCMAIVTLHLKAVSMHSVHMSNSHEVVFHCPSFSWQVGAKSLKLPIPD